MQCGFPCSVAGCTGCYDCGAGFGGEDCSSLIISLRVMVVVFFWWRGVGYVCELLGLFD